MRDQTILKLQQIGEQQLKAVADKHNELAQAFVQLAKEHAQTRGMYNAFINLSFWNRMKWLFRGVQAFQKQAGQQAPPNTPPMPDIPADTQ